jgi:rRNA maturation endonuclease Nob1
MQILVAQDDSIWSREHPTAILLFEFEDIDACKVNIGVTEGNGRLSTGGIREFIEDYASRNGLKVSNLNSDIDVPYSPRVYKPTPKSFLKNCVRCGREIPIASEECKYCGAHQPEGR